MAAEGLGHDPVVVGVDGSSRSLAAVELAAGEAARRRLPLKVLCGLARSPLGLTLSPLDTVSADDEGVSDRILGEAVARARAAAPGVAVTGEIVSASGTEALIASSVAATLVVVGDRGRSGFAGLQLGSVAVHVASHASCPVLVARGTVERHRPVLLATDCSAASGPAVGFAIDEAQALGVPLVALHVWTHPTSSPSDLQPLAYNESRVMDEEARLLSETLAGWRQQYPDVDVEPRVMHGRIRSTIIAMTARAQLVVVGARGRGGFTGLLLGSVSHALLHHAACPVAIIPHVRHRKDAMGKAADRQPTTA